METEAKTITDLAPIDPLMRIAWVDCLMWAGQDKTITEQYAKETGWKPAASAIEKAIDAATGADYARAVNFVEWFNANIWGKEEKEST